MSKKKIKNLTPTEKAPEVKPDVDPGTAPVLPIVSKTYRDPLTDAKVVITHDPNKGEYVEEVTAGGHSTKTKHVTLSHAWARLEEVK